MESADRFGDILEHLDQSGLKFIVCGGMAAVIHGVERTTLDLDLSVSLHPDNIPLLIQTVEGLGFVPRVPVNPMLLAEEEAVQDMIQKKHAIVFTFIDPSDPFVQLDIFLLPELRYEQLIGSTEQVSFRGGSLKVLSVEKLLELKEGIQPPRPKDMMDILVLKEILNERKG